MIPIRMSNCLANSLSKIRRRPVITVTQWACFDLPQGIGKCLSLANVFHHGKHGNRPSSGTKGIVEARRNGFSNHHSPTATWRLLSTDYTDLHGLRYKIKVKSEKLWNLSSS